MATASFNQEITPPSNLGEIDTYDLTQVLTLEGFDLNTIKFKLTYKVTGLSVNGNTLYVNYGSYGSITILVYDELGGIASASTNIKMTYGYTYLRYFSENSNPSQSYEIVRKDWVNIITR